MLSRSTLLPACAGFIALLCAGRAKGWGCEGHEVVALVARAHLSRAAAAAADKLLRDYPPDPSLKRFCRNHPAGDISQPLHDTDNRDRGGNCVAIALFRRTKPENLHAVWDSEILARDPRIRRLGVVRYADALDRTYASRRRSWGAPDADVKQWAWEAHAIAVDSAYGRLRPRIPMEPAGAGAADQAACDGARARTEE